MKKFADEHGIEINEEVRVTQASPETIAMLGILTRNVGKHRLNGKLVEVYEDGNAKVLPMENKEHKINGNKSGSSKMAQLYAWSTKNLRRWFFL